MDFIVNITPSARADIRFFKIYEQRIIATGIRTFLTRDVLVETDRRKLLKSNTFASWELRIDAYRIFYEVDGDTIHILAVGHKNHNDLYIRGKKVKL